MIHNKLFTRKDGSKIQVRVSLHISGIDEISYRVTMSFCEPRKRTFINVVNNDNYQYRALDSDGRKKYEMEKFLEYCTAEEIMEVKKELWQKLNPENK